MYATQTAIFGLAQMTGSTPQSGVTGTAAQPGNPGQGQAPLKSPCGDPMTLIFMFGIFVVFYFLLIRPQQKKAKEHQKMLQALKPGDEVVTNGGLIGKITGISDQTMTVEISEKVRVRVLKSQVNKLELAGEKK
jgi:preprotein translocase subunit YajC